MSLHKELALLEKAAKAAKKRPAKKAKKKTAKKTAKKKTAKKKTAKKTAKKKTAKKSSKKAGKKAGKKKPKPAPAYGAHVTTLTGPNGARVAYVASATGVEAHHLTKPPERMSVATARGEVDRLLKRGYRVSR